MKLVAAVKLTPSPEQAALLRSTLARCNEAATWLAQAGFDAGIFGQYALHKLAYADMRQRFSLTAQAAVRTIAKVADAFKANKDVAPVFRPDAAQPYDDRIMRSVQDGNAVSLWTLITTPHGGATPSAVSRGTRGLLTGDARGVWHMDLVALEGGRRGAEEVGVRGARRRVRVRGPHRSDRRW